MSGERTALMSSISIHKPVLLRSSHVIVKCHPNFHKINIPPSLKIEANNVHARKMKEQSLELSTTALPQARPQLEPLKKVDVQFDRVQTPEEDLAPGKKFEFGQFVAREAILDEEIWVAAWLRAESKWEDKPNDRYAESNKRQFTDQEFNAIKRRKDNWLFGTIATCIVTLRKEAKNVKRPVLRSVVGTLDVGIKYMLEGETFPGEWVNPPRFGKVNRSKSSGYGYISNLCVTKSARRKGIASNMMQFAINLAMSNGGVEQIYVHAHRKNKAAQEMYQKLGFEIIEKANDLLAEEQTYLLHFKA